MRWQGGNNRWIHCFSQHNLSPSAKVKLPDYSSIVYVHHCAKGNLEVFFNFPRATWLETYWFTMKFIQNQLLVLLLRHNSSRTPSSSVILALTSNMPPNAMASFSVCQPIVVSLPSPSKIPWFLAQMMHGVSTGITFDLITRIPRKEVFDSLNSAKSNTLMNTKTFFFSPSE